MAGGVESSLVANLVRLINSCYYYSYEYWPFESYFWHLLTPLVVNKCFLWLETRPA